MTTLINYCSPLQGQDLVFHFPISKGTSISSMINPGVALYLVEPLASLEEYKNIPANWYSIEPQFSQPIISGTGLNVSSY